VRKKLDRIAAETAARNTFGLALAKAMPIANAARRLGGHDTRLWADRRTLRLARGEGAGFV